MTEDSAAAAIRELVADDAWMVVRRALKTRIRLHKETLACSTPTTPEEAFVLVHRQQGMIGELQAMLDDPIAFFTPEVVEEQRT